VHILSKTHLVKMFIWGFEQVHNFGLALQWSKSQDQGIEVVENETSHASSERGASGMVIL